MVGGDGEDRTDEAIFVELNDAFLLQNDNLRTFFDKTSEGTQRQ